MTDRATAARTLPPLAGFLEQPYAAAFYRLRALGLSAEAAFILAANGLGPTSVAALDAERTAVTS